MGGNPKAGSQAERGHLWGRVDFYAGWRPGARWVRLLFCCSAVLKGRSKPFLELYGLRLIMRSVYISGRDSLNVPASLPARCDASLELHS
jgi:hypothetical protein